MYPGSGNDSPRGAIQADLRDGAAKRLQQRELFLQPQPRRDEDLVVAAASGVHASAGVAEAFGQTRFDGGVAVLVALVEHEGAAFEILRQRSQFALQGSGLVSSDHADIRQAFHVRLAGGDVVEEKLAIQQHIVAGKEAHDFGVDARVGFVPERLSHGESRSVRRSPMQG